LGKFNSVDPMADSRNWLTPYNYVQNNPLIRVDPAGTIDWYTNESGEFEFDEDITSQAALDKAGVKGTYQGAEGWEVNENNGDLIHYTVSGQKNEGAFWAGEVTVTANPVEMAVYQAGKDFAVGALEVTSYATGEVSTAFNAVGSVVAPFAPPVGALLLGAGSALGGVSTLTSFGADALSGNLTGQNAFEIGAYFAGEALSNQIEKSGFGLGAKVALEGITSVSMDITTKIVVPKLFNKK
jgi:hypothetical protein